MRKTMIGAICGLSAFMLSGCNSTPITPQTWFTGLSHSTVWGSFAVLNTGATQPTSTCQANTPPKVDPPLWWSTQPPAITNISDAIGTTIWSSTDLSCPRAMQTLYRSEMIADLTNLYSKLQGTTQPGGLISKAVLEFNVVNMTPTNPLNFPCDPYIGAAGMVNVLRRNPVVTQGASQLPIGTSLHAGLIQATSSGLLDGPNTIAAFPAAGDMAANLGLVTGPGTFANGTLIITDTGPGIHNVKIDVSRWVIGAVNLNMQSIGFSVAGINEATINPTTAVQFDCRSWVEPIQLNVQHL